MSNKYYDSVQLMRIASDIESEYNISDAYAIMGTDANKQLLEESSLIGSEPLSDVDPDDLVLSVAGADAKETAQALETMRKRLTVSDEQASETQEKSELRARTLEQAANGVDTPEIVLISVPSEYARREAWKALHEGMHVHLFSDGVSLATERELKKYALEHNQLLMGPDCGSALIDGVPLGFANEVRRGSVGVVSASGTGLQEVTCLLHRAGLGVSQAIGTGGRDLSETVGGLATCDAIERLDGDPMTEQIIVVSKSPDEAALRAVQYSMHDCSTPVVAHFQRTDVDEFMSDNIERAETLAAAAATVAQAVDTERAQPSIIRDQQHSGLKANDIDTIASREPCTVRGLFCGGTLCAEAASILDRGVLSLQTNVGIGSEVEDSAAQNHNILVDLGADELTRGRPHPMIDSSIRDERLREALHDETVGIVLLDVVLGYGTEANPVAGIIDAITSAPNDETVVVTSVCGTDADPQDRRQQVQKLEDAGVVVAPSNAAAARVVSTALEQGSQGNLGR